MTSELHVLNRKFLDKRRIKENMILFVNGNGWPK
jgi:hypothetical protein